MSMLDDDDTDRRQLACESFLRGMLVARFIGSLDEPTDEFWNVAIEPRDCRLGR